MTAEDTPDFDAMLVEAKRAYFEMWDSPLLDERSRESLRRHIAGLTVDDVFGITPRAYHTGRKP